VGRDWIAMIAYEPRNMGLEGFWLTRFHQDGLADLLDRAGLGRSVTNAPRPSVRCSPPPPPTPAVGYAVSFLETGPTPSASQSNLWHPDQTLSYRRVDSRVDMGMSIDIHRCGAGGGDPNPTDAPGSPCGPVSAGWSKPPRPGGCTTWHAISGSQPQTSTRSSERSGWLRWLRSST
jgi:hypothetical protein